MRLIYELSTRTPVPLQPSAGDDTPMSELPTTARAVVIGAGIVGNSLSHHLAELGWRELAIEAGALTISANTEVLGIDVERGRIRRVRTTRGDIETEIVVVACGVWSPAIARMAGASIPLTPAVHQMIDIGPVPRFASSTRHIEYPIVRDMDTFMYERQDGIGLEI